MRRVGRANVRIRQSEGCPRSWTVRAGTALRGTPSLELVRILPEDEEHAWTFFIRHRDKDYSYTDCTSFALMRRLGLTVAVTTDRHFRQAGFGQLP